MYRRIVLKIMQTKFYSWLLLRVIPFVRFSTYYTSLRGDKYHAGYKVLQPGQFGLSLDRKKLTGMLIPGFMSHAWYCVAKRPPYDAGTTGIIQGEQAAVATEIVEMTHTNFTQSQFFDICKESDRVIICTCLDWDMAYKNLMTKFAWKFQDALYDTKFKLGVFALYCSELIYQADLLASGGKNPRLQVDLCDLAGIGQEYISPDGLLFAKNTKVLWDSDGELQGKMGPEVEAYLRAKGGIK